MPGPYDPEDIHLYVAATEAGPYTELFEMTSQSLSAGSDSTVRTHTFGRSTPHVKAGDHTSSYSLSGLLNWDDAGQTILRDAYEDKTAVWFRRVFGDPPTTVGLHRTTEKCMVTEAPDSADADGDWVENGFTLEGFGDRLKDTVPAP